MSAHAHEWRRWDSMGDYGYQCACGANVDDLPREPGDSMTLPAEGRMGEQGWLTCSRCGSTWHSTYDHRCRSAPALSAEEQAIVDRFEGAPDPFADDYPPSHDRIYPRCPACRREQYGPAVIGFSQGEYGCHHCGHVIREDARFATGGAA